LIFFQNIVAEEREVQAMEKIRKEEEKAIREKAREEARKRREAKRKERMDLNDFKIKGLKEWEINYEFHIGMNVPIFNTQLPYFVTFTCKYKFPTRD